MKTRLFFVSVIVFLASACMSTTTVQKTKIHKVNRVAIIGFDLFVPATNSLASSKQKTLLAEEIYRQVSLELSSQLGWNILSQQDLISSLRYQDHYKNGKDKTGLRFSLGEYLSLTGILPGKAVLSMSPLEKERLARELNVDTLITFEVKGVEGSSISYFDSIELIKYELVIDEFFVFLSDTPEEIVYLDNLRSGLPDGIKATLDVEGVGIRDSQLTWLTAAIPLLAKQLTHTIKTEGTLP